MANLEKMGRQDNRAELEERGFTIVPGVLSDGKVQRARAAIVSRMEKLFGHEVDLASETGKSYEGSRYVPYLLYVDPVFEDILLEPAPLALITYLLGESCLLSSLGSHPKGPGGMPLLLHSDGYARREPYEAISEVANINYALTPYTQETGPLAIVRGSHKSAR